MVFHGAAFTASQVGLGLALGAAVGTLGRFASGALLDRGLRCSLPVLLAALLALVADGLLFGAHEFGGYLLGQLLFGAAVGLYWPAMELAVSLSCEPLPSARGYALARSADALGIAVGALIGAGLAAAGHLRGIYLVDISCLALVVALLLRRPLAAPAPLAPEGRRSDWHLWLPPLLPMLTLTVVATAIPALMQSALPLDLVRGGLQRPALPEGTGALLIGGQLGLLLLIQWPVGQFLAKRPLRLGLTISLLSFSLGCALLAFSALSSGGAGLVALALFPVALGEAAFLPIATEAVVDLTPIDHQGLAMALFSQCFAVSSFAAPLLAGWSLDHHHHGLWLWLGMALACLLGLPLVVQIGRYDQQRRLAGLGTAGNGG
jgi:MFS family permease